MSQVMKKDSFKKYTVIIWGMGKTYDRFYNVLKYEEMKGNIEVKGIVSLDTYISSKDGYQVLNREEILGLEWDYIIVMAVDVNYKQIVQWAVEHNIGNERLIAGEAFGIPGFDFCDYVKIKRENISIIADCCWGGLVCQRLKLAYMSPFIGIYITGKDYIRLLENLKYYLSKPLEMDMELSAYRNMPIASLADISISFPHAVSFQEAQIKWNARKKRVNFDNLLIEMRIDSNVEMAERFDALPYNKKIGFSSVRMDGLDSICYLPEFGIEYSRRRKPIEYEMYEDAQFWDYVVSSQMMNNIDYFSLLNGNMLNIRRRTVGEYEREAREYNVREKRNV